MRGIHLSLTASIVVGCAKAVLLVLAATVPMLLIGRQILGEAIIAMVYLALIGSASGWWGRLAGACAALTASLTFDFFFIPPFLTFAVGSLEGWLVLTFFLAVAILVIGRFQDALSRARQSQREAIFMYELATALAGLRTREAVLQALARNLQQMFFATLVEVFVGSSADMVPAIVKAPPDAQAKGRPDRIVPILAPPGLIGEIRLWRGDGWLPGEDSRLLDGIAALAATALERARAMEIEFRANTLSAVAGG